MNDNHPGFSGGRNIALKIPPHEFDETVRFYRDILGLRQLQEHLPSHVFEFGHNLLWLDRVETMTQTEIWLELRTPDSAHAAKWLADNDVPRCDTVERLPDSFDGFWISSPGNIVHLVHGRKKDQ